LQTVSYYRNSIDESKQQMSIEMQKKTVREKADKLMVLIDEEYADRSTSARKNKTQERNDMGRLISKIKKGQIKQLLVYSRCRLARNVEDYMKLYYLLKEKNVQVHFAADYEFPMFYTAEAELIERIIAAVNQQEAERIVYKLKDSKKTKAKSGKHAAGGINYGYKKGENKGDEWDIDPIKAKNVEDIYSFFLNWEFHSMTEFAEMITKHGLRYKEEDLWTSQRIGKILRNPIYKGLRIYHDKEEGKEYASYVPEIKIIEKDIWERVQVKLNDHSRESSPTTSDERATYLLNGLIVCGECGEPVRGRKYGSKHVYKCTHNARIRVKKECFEEEVINKANEFFLDLVDSYMAKLLGRMKEEEVRFYQSAIDRFSKEISNAKGRIIQKGQLWAENDDLLLDESLSEQLRSFEGKQFLKQELESKVYDLNEKYSQFERVKEGAELAIIKPEMEDDEKIELIKDIVHTITLDSEKANITFKHPYKERLIGRDSIELG
jgi:site-specific DNA recombinase